MKSLISTYQILSNLSKTFQKSSLRSIKIMRNYFYKNDAGSPCGLNKQIKIFEDKLLLSKTRLLVLNSGEFWIEKPQNWNLRSNLLGTAVYIAKTSSDKKKPNSCFGGKSMFQKYVKII